MKAFSDAAFDLKVGEKVFLNADLKYVAIRSDVSLAASGQKVTAVKVDPWLIGFGIGYRF